MMGREFIALKIKQWFTSKNGKLPATSGNNKSKIVDC